MQLQNYLYIFLQINKQKIFVFFEKYKIIQTFVSFYKIDLNGLNLLKNEIAINAKSCVKYIINHMFDYHEEKKNQNYHVGMQRFYGKLRIKHMRHRVEGKTCQSLSLADSYLFKILSGP